MNQIEQEKDAKIGELRKHIEDLSQDFSTMLKDTLEKMKQKIEAANEKWETENENAIQKRFDEYNRGESNK